MNQRELIQAMVDCGATFFDAKETYRSTVSTLGEQIARFGVAEIAGVGTFSARVSHRPAREVLNPFTRQPLTIAARDIIRIIFAPDSALVSAIDADSVGAPPLDSQGILHGAFLAGLTGRQRAVRLARVGAFVVCKLPAQRARLHPRTGAVIAPAMPARRDVVFRAANELKATVLAALRKAREDEER